MHKTTSQLEMDTHVIGMDVRTIGQWPRIDPEQQARERVRERARYIKFLKYVMLGMLTMGEASRALGVSAATLDRWRRDLLADDREDTDDLRKLSQARKHWRENK